MSSEIVKSKNKKKTKKTEDTSDLLSTASDLYRQIEAAAASALSTHPSFAASFPPPPTGTATDEAYWTSLPQHLRQFIRSALPLAAGLTQPNNSTQLGIGVGLTQVNGQPLPPLTHEQLSSAAAQLAQVVQSNWGQLGLGPIPPGAQQQISNSTNGNSRTNTISLGSFPVTMPTREQMEAAIGSIGAMEIGSNPPIGMRLEEEEMYDLTEEEDVKEGIQLNPSKKKKKKKNKKAAVEEEYVTIPMDMPDYPLDTSSNPDQDHYQSSHDATPQTIAAGKQPVPPSKYPQSSFSKTNQVQSTPSIAPKAGPSSEREKIRDFWLTLKEKERRHLVTVEKKAVLQKMKDQQKAGCCVCAVCGRKRTAIEEELEVLYDAYYDELESYALHQVRYASSGGTIAPPPGPGPFPGSVDSSTLPSPSIPAPVKKSSIKTTRDHKNVRPMKKTVGVGKRDEGPAHGEPGHTHSTSCPHHPGNFDTKTSATKGEKAKGAEVLEGDFESDEGEFGDEEEEEEDYDEEEEEFDEEDENSEDRKKRIGDVNGNANVNNDGKPPAASTGADFFGFGKSLTVKGGILTVADDLMKNDGQKFLEMMEQLADKRIQRERDSTVLLESSSSGSEDDGEEGDEYGSDEEEDSDEEDEEEEQAMTEEERMEEGRRMFQIFAARMFEQRVLTAYREKVASDRQTQLLKDLEEEDRLAEEKEIKKARENQKKKDKKKDQKQKKEEDRLLKQAEKDALDLSFRLSESIRIEEERRRSEELRTKREAERKLKEEERQRVSEEKRKRAEEETRKRKEKEEKAKIEKELRITKEKEDREKKAKEDAERKARDLADRLEREEKAEKERVEKERVELEIREKAEKERLAKAAQAAATAAARIKAQTAKSIPLRPPTATKAIPGLAKSPTPVKAPVATPISNGPPPPFRNGMPIQRQSSISNSSVSNNLSSPPPMSSIGYGRPPPMNGPPLIPTGPSSYGHHPQQQQMQQQQQQQRIPSQPPPPPMQSIPSSGIPSAASRSFGPAGGFGNWNANSTPSYPNQQTSSFVAHPQTQHSIGQVSPVLQRAPIGPPPPLPNILSAPLISRGIEGGNGGPSPRVNGFAPIGPPPVISQSQSSNLISPIPIARGPIGTIGSRPPGNGGISAIGSGRGGNVSPPRFFGSSALREDDEIVPSSSSNGGGRGGSGNWNSPFGSIWSSAAPISTPVPIQQQPDRLSVIRDRARISFLRIGAREVALGDLHELLGKLFEDSGSVDLRELVESMLVPGNGGNGGGLFSFRERGEGLLVAFDG